MPFAVAVVVAGEQRLDRAEARRLDVDGLGRERERLDVGDRVDRRVPGDAVAVGLERGVGLGLGQVGVLEPGVGQRLGDPAVERRVGVDVDRRALVGALEVDRGDRAGLDELLDQLAGPVGRAVELEAQPRVDLEPVAHRLEARRVAEPQRDDEADRAVLAAQHVAERAAGLAQREVERGALDRPAAVEPEGRHAAARRPGKRSSSPTWRANLVERPLAGERERRAARLLLALLVGVVGDVLAEALLAGAAQVERRGDARELRRDGALAALERVLLDGERQLGDAFVRGHDGTRH